MATKAATLKMQKPATIW